MRRFFSKPVTALLAGALLRLFFVLKFPAGSGDSALYEQLATNWLKFGKYALDVAGELVPVDVRMPGYPAFLAMVYGLAGRTGEQARIFVMLAQVAVDLASCVFIAVLASLLISLCGPPANCKRGFAVALWMAALCPFTANYVAVPLTEVWAVSFTALAMAALVVLVARENTQHFSQLGAFGWFRDSYWLLVAILGFVVGLGTLFRPETPLLLATTVLLLAWSMLRRGEIRRWILTCLVMGAACLLPLLPWTLRNAITLHEFQPLGPKNAILPGELEPRGFMAWERSWLYRVRDSYLVTWKLNDEAINVEDIPANAFDTAEEKEQVAVVLKKYNDELSWTAEEDEVFAELARGRTRRHPLRTYLSIPLRRAGRMWFTPRIELLPVSGHVFPLAKMREEDPEDQEVTIAFFFLNLLYVGLGLWGAYKLWRQPGARHALAALLLYLVVRTAFLTTQEAPEPRYVLVCFPALIAFGAVVFAGKEKAKIVLPDKR
jgi:hypothetical protein